MCVMLFSLDLRAKNETSVLGDAAKGHLCACAGSPGVLVASIHGDAACCRLQACAWLPSWRLLADSCSRQPGWWWRGIHLVLHLCTACS